MKYYLYIVECADGTFYTGITTDVARRLEEHNNDDVKGAKYTKIRRPVCLVYNEVCVDRSAASSREYHIKKLSRTQKKQLITAKN